MIDSSIRWLKSFKLVKPRKSFLLLPFFTISSKSGSISTSDALKSLEKNKVAKSYIANNICFFD